MKNYFEIPPMFEKLPTWLFMSWAEYKGETFFVDVDIQKSLACHRPVVNLHYCATRGMNGLVLRTVNYKPGDFKRSRLDSRTLPA